MEDIRGRCSCQYPPFDKLRLNGGHGDFYSGVHCLPNFRVNPLMAVDQGEKIRLVINMSSPKGNSFNDNIKLEGSPLKKHYWLCSYMYCLDRGSQCTGGEKSPKQITVHDKSSGGFSVLAPLIRRLQDIRGTRIIRGMKSDVFG
jgi:hypothetical protein